MPQCFKCCSQCQFLRGENQVPAFCQGLSHVLTNASISWEEELLLLHIFVKGACKFRTLVSFQQLNQWSAACVTCLPVPCWTTSSQDWILLWHCSWLIQEELWAQAELTQSSSTRGLPWFLLSLPLSAPGDLLPEKLWTCGASQSSKCTARLGSLFKYETGETSSFQQKLQEEFQWWFCLVWGRFTLYLMQFLFPDWVTVSPGISIWGRRPHCWLQCSLEVSLCSLLARCV